MQRNGVLLGGLRLNSRASFLIHGTATLAFMTIRHDSLSLTHAASLLRNLPILKPLHELAGYIAVQLERGMGNIRMPLGNRHRRQGTP